MIGDENDFGSRLRLTLPDHWFADTPPVLQGLLGGLSSAWAMLYSVLQVVKQQSRIATATNGFLDLASADFFADRLPRRTSEDDNAFRARILAAMQRERATRASLIAAASDAGFTAQVFEPARIADTGAYSVAGAIAWSVAGGWGSLEMPLECLVTAQGGSGADQGILEDALTQALPAGGIAWLRVTD